MVNTFLECGGKVLAMACRGSSAEAEVYGVEEKESTIEIKKGEIDAFEVSHSRGMALRLLENGRMGMAHTTRLDNKGLKSLVIQARSNMDCNGKDPFNSLSLRTESSLPGGIFDDRLSLFREEDKIEKTKAMEQKALSYSEEVKKIRSVSYGDRERYSLLMNSRSLLHQWKETSLSLTVELMAQRGDQSEVGWESDHKRNEADLLWEDVPLRAARQAVEMLGAKKIATCTVPVLFDHRVVCDLLGILSPSFSADNMQKGKSLFEGKMGKKLLSPLITMMDKGDLEGGLGSAPVDGEGTAMGETLLVDEGVVEGVLHNLYTAKKEGLRSTGNGVRSSIEQSPSVGKTNLFIKGGTLSEKEMLSSLERGLFITEAMGVHTANPVSGDFSLGVSGYWIEKGCRLFPVRGVALAGNIIELFRQVDGVGNNFRFIGRTGTPWIRVPSMEISGE